LVATGVVVPFSSLADPGLAGSGGHTEDQQRQFMAQGEQVIAVQHRKVSFKPFSSKTADEARLAKKASSVSDMNARQRWKTWKMPSNSLDERSRSRL
jgi:hypothetical protein